MGHVGLKPWAYKFLWPQYPKAYPLNEVADLASEAGIKGRGRDDRFNFTTTMRRWVRSGDAHQDPRFGQRRDERGRLLIFAYAPNQVPDKLNGHPLDTSELKVHKGLNSDDLASLLVEQGQFAHIVDALKAIGNLSLRGRSVPAELLTDFEAIIEQERQVQNSKKQLISQFMSYIQSAS